MEERSHKSRIRMRKKRRRKRLAIFLLLSAFMIFATAGLGLLWMWQQTTGLMGDTFERIERSNNPNGQEEGSIADDNVSVLFLGVDNRDGEVSGISDAMILTTFNQEEQSVKMLSIPRDSYVDIPERPGHEKINHAHAYGGHNLAIETVENFLDVPIDYYVTVNFQAFIDIVDTFGGIDIDSDISFSEQDADGNHDQIYIEQGEQTLSGEEALAYARHRQTDGVLARGERHTEVMVALIQEAASISNIGNYNQVFDNLQNNMRHNFESFQQLTAFHSYASSLDELERFQLEGEPTRIEGSEYIVVDDQSIAHASNMLRRHLDLDYDPSAIQDHAAPSEDEQT
ncbi:LCP family protein [Geomicrobium sp. JCM 19039]|uniref:LCP family protein n=1 Tax=Geomicrobium sp. JCM 19039 TaxID=1460636 RepID=UPI00045F157C|nr:LCP family protein [Geomicrobium sp. JCM 19039]GAK11625.1 cell envelope-associated transcriptional attenuator LytR-CpsA-Psr [Geomicrobium sp. JCM 19039]